MASLTTMAAALWLFGAPPAPAAAVPAVPMPANRALPMWAPPVTTGNLAIVGMSPTEIVEWAVLKQKSTNGDPLAVVFAKATTDVGATVLDEVLATKHSIGIYSYRTGLDRWLPVWERVTGQMGVAFVEGYDILDVNGDGSDDVCVKIRYYGEGRALDYTVMSVDEGRVREMFEEKSIYHGSVTAATGYIVIDEPVREQLDMQKTTIYAVSRDRRAFEKIREIRGRISK